MATNRDRYANNSSDSDSDSESGNYLSFLRKLSPFKFRQRLREASHSSSSSMAAETFDSDVDFAFNLQLQEALAASLVVQSPSSTATPAAKTVRARPFGEGSSRTAGESSTASASASTSQASDSTGVFALYFKGLVAEEKAGIGVAICDRRGNMIFDARKALSGDGINRVAADVTALIEGLNAALSLDVKRIVLCCDNPTTHKLISGRWTSRQRKVSSLIDQATTLRKKFVLCNSRVLPRNEVSLAVRLAREAVESPPAERSQPRKGPGPAENCAICSEDRDSGQMFSVEPCGHRYCAACMRQHVEYKLRAGALSPKCPHERCESELNVAICQKFLSPEFADVMRQRRKEATIPVGERVYCPNPKCSALMSKTEVAEYSRRCRIDVVGSFCRKCVKCRRIFCLNCRATWHGAVSCDEHRRSNPNPHADDAKLKLLASANMWSQCKKCSLIIELAGGCYHMKCRCGYEFCYNCGAEWKDKKATCECPLWDERNIVRDGNIDNDDDDEEEQDYEYESDSEEDQIYYNEDFGVYFRA